MNNNPIITIQQAWDIMNQFDDQNQPIPFSVMGTYATEDEKDPKFGKILKHDNVIMLRNEKYLLADASNPPRTNQEMIFDRNWMLYNPKTQEKKSISHWHLAYVNDMEIN